jgi:hypothetical protein
MNGCTARVCEVPQMDGSTNPMRSFKYTDLKGYSTCLMNEQNGAYQDKAVLGNEPA